MKVHELREFLDTVDDDLNVTVEVDLVSYDIESVDLSTDFGVEEVVIST